MPRRTATSPIATGRARRTAPTPSARCWTQEPSSRTGPTRRSRSSTRSRGSAGVLRTIDDRPAWHPEQTLTVEQAFRTTCVTPAWLSYDEHRRGKLVPGYLADLVVLDRDPFELEELADVEVVATMVGGRWTHNPRPGTRKGWRNQNVATRPPAALDRTTRAGWRRSRAALRRAGLGSVPAPTRANAAVLGCACPSRRSGQRGRRA